MQKKIFNWLGWLLVCFYVIIIVLLSFIGYRMDQFQRINYRNYCYSAVTLMVIASGAVIPYLLYISLGKLLPYKREIATVVFKEISIATARASSGLDAKYVHRIITFQLLTGDRKVFKIPFAQWYSILEGEQGVLTYKEQGKNLYFVQFERRE